MPVCWNLWKKQFCVFYFLRYCRSKFLENGYKMTKLSSFAGIVIATRSKYISQNIPRKWETVLCKGGSDPRTGCFWIDPPSQLVIGYPWLAFLNQVLEQSKIQLSNSPIHWEFWAKNRLYLIDLTKIAKILNSVLHSFKNWRIFWDKKIDIFDRLLRSKCLEDSLNFEYKVDHDSTKNRKIEFSFVSAHSLRIFHVNMAISEKG